MENVKNFEEFINEGSAEPDIAPVKTPVKTPTKTPQKTPNKRPQKPSPFRKDEPSELPGPKASLKDVVTRVKKVSDMGLMNTMKNKY